jgi:two-component system C4-dicarboxylate transport sensor histidine kinase DctB
MIWRRPAPADARSGGQADPPPPGLSWAVRGLIALVVLVAIAVVYFANVLLTNRFVETTRQRAELRQSLYAGSVVSELQRNSVVPLLLARDPTLIAALNARDFSASSQRLISYVDEIGAAAITLIDTQGRAVAATDRSQLGTRHEDADYFTQALESPDTVFTISPSASGGTLAAFSRTVVDGTRPLGVLMVEVDLAQFETRWRGTTAAVVVTDAAGRVVLSTEPRWRGLPLEEALAALPVPSALRRAFGAGLGEPSAPIMSGEALIRLEARVPFRGWRLVTFTSYDSVRERVNGVLALIITGFALLLALGFYFLNRRTTLRSLLVQRESRELRLLNLRLSREIAERKRVQEALSETEQSLAQSSKLAALGEMSASVSHELNQPLAAMRTYLAGARLLLSRRRNEEAMTSLQRIDDLIGRMGALTRQLKSYARKGGEAFEPVDLRHALAAALALMEPQLRRSRVKLSRVVPDVPVTVVADRLRLEQVIINLVRNALDAMKDADQPELDILLTQGEEAVLAIRDSGHGIGEPEKLFEPFYTTKKPGEGVGLGLAISSGIVKDLGGRLLARNAERGGAVFELRLPVMASDAELDGGEATAAGADAVEIEAGARRPAAE